MTDHASARAFANRVVRNGKSPDARALARAYLALLLERERLQASLRSVLWRVDSTIAELDQEPA